MANRRLRRYRVLKIKEKQMIRYAYAILLTAFFIVFAAMMEASMPVIDRIEFFDQDIPAAFDGYKIIFVSDIHTGLYLNSQALPGLVQFIHSEKPDIVLLGGDYINYEPSQFESVAEGLKGISAKDGVYGVLGNHDIWGGVDAAKRFFSALHVKSLENTSFLLEKRGEHIYLSGTEEAMFGHPDLKRAVEGINENDFNIMVTHNPLLFAIKEENYYNDKIDLALMGHTHGGQISFFGLWSLWTDQFADFYRPSVRDRNGFKYILSNGFGTTFMPFRFYCPPQVHVITLRSQK